MKAAVFAPLYNTPNRKDASGAFQPEARAFVADNHLLANVSLFDCNRAMVDRRAEVSRSLAKQSDIFCYAFFCHGWKSGLQIGFRAPQAQALADLLVLGGQRDCTVIFYACDAARDSDDDRADDTQTGPGGDGGMADLVAQAMRARGWDGRLFAHATPGHTTMNPWVRVWAPGENGEWLVDPKSPLWPKWRHALRGELRFRFPFMPRVAIEATLKV